MANHEVTQALNISEAIKERVARWMETRETQRAHRRIYRQAVSELRSLSDRDLADLGLRRCMIKSVALEAADQKVRM